MQLSDEIKNALIEAGWYPNRKINIMQYKNALEREGYEVPQKLQNFLIEFGGLKLKVPHFMDITAEMLKKYPMIKKPKVSYEIMHFDVMEAIGIPSEYPMQKEDIFEPRIGAEMILFGEVFDGRYRLTMTPNGNVYARDGESILFMGGDYIEMLENIFHKKEMREIL